MANDAVAWVGVGLGVLSFVWTEGRFRRQRKARLAVGPAEEIRMAVTTIRGYFTDMTAVGQRTPYFIEERREAGQRLRDLGGQLDDRRLRELLEDAARFWDQAFAHAPAPQGPRAYSLTGPIPEAYLKQDRADNEQSASQADCAQQGLDLCRQALDRVNELARRKLS